jgi:hypothetical protein
MIDQREKEAEKGSMIPVLAMREKTVKNLDKKKRRHQPAFQSAAVEA